MADVGDLLVEIGTEELPPRALKGLAEAFGSGVAKELEACGLAFRELRHYATPRRLAVQAFDLPTAQPGRVRERRGPSLTAAFDNLGRPTQAAQGFAQSCGVGVAQLQRAETEKGAWLVFRTLEQGRPTRELVPEIVARALTQLPVPKRMRWGELTDTFVRPVRWFVLLFGTEVVPAQMFGVRSGRETYGHRFHHPQAIYLTEPAAYAPLLQDHCHVMADFDARREAIRAQVADAARRAGGTALISEDLLEEVTSLVEWPVALLGRFPEAFLEIPREVVVSTMQAHQRYFPVVDGDGRLMPLFITVSNIESRDPAMVVAGNERVIRPRLSDAAFFWEQDRKFPLEDHLKVLHTVTFQERLGSLYDKTLRVARLAQGIAARLGWSPSFVHRAAMISKCDLMTAMVGEFPELQGTMGRYLATHDGEPAEIAAALEEVYLPRYAGGELPQTQSGQVLAIADRLDTLVGIFGVGQPPSGDKDPFGLRRAALGVLRIVIERGLGLDLMDLLDEAAKGYGDRLAPQDGATGVFTFMMERLRAYYLEKGVRPDEFEAVIALGHVSAPYDFDRRVRAVTAFRKLPEAESLTAANKRIRNILRQAAQRAESVPARVDPELLEDPAERALHQRMQDLDDQLNGLFQADRYDYAAVLRCLAGLRDTVDSFFDKVMVMVESPALRANRLALLTRLSSMFLRVADVSRLQG
jgi:glycyl-tRNA synthetase beta chain